MPTGKLLALVALVLDVVLAFLLFLVHLSTAPLLLIILFFSWLTSCYALAEKIF